jgi:hypothetical protein
MKNSARVSFLLLLLQSAVAGAAAPPVAAAPSSSASLTRESDGDVQAQLKSSVAQSIQKLGALQPWQKRIFDEEVVPQYSRFIKDYRNAPGGGLSVEVDADGIRKYLAFYGPLSVKKGEQKVIVLLVRESSCEKCTESFAGIQEVVKQKLERRGLAPVWLSSDEMVDRALTGRTIEERLADQAQARNAAGAMLIEWKQAPVDSLDSAHADEKHYRIRTHFLLRADRDLRHEGALEIMEDDRFESAANRLLADSMTDFGAKALLSSLVSGDDTAPELTIDITGVKDFAHYQRVRSQVTERLKDIVPIEERKVARGRLTFAIKGSRKLDEIRRALASAPAGGEAFRVVSQVENELKLDAGGAQ